MGELNVSDIQTIPVFKVTRVHRIGRGVLANGLSLYDVRRTPRHVFFVADGMELRLDVISWTWTTPDGPYIYFLEHSQNTERLNPGCVLTARKTDVDPESAET